MTDKPSPESADPEAVDPKAVEKQVTRWLEEAVIGLNLCPFARPVYAGDQVRFAVASQPTFDKVILESLVEVDKLLDEAPDDIATTLIIYADALSEFDEFLEAIGVIQALLSEAGADGILQVAHFHPDYQFTGTEPDDLENYTNRAPYPIIQLLREAQVSEAVERHPDAESIPQQNIETLDALGRDGVQKLWSTWAEQNANE